MFASTTQARNLLKLAFQSCNIQVPTQTYTDKTSESDPNRRSVVYVIWGDKDTEKVYISASKLFKEFGYNESTIKVTTSNYSGASYLRVIAYKDSILG